MTGVRLQALPLRVIPKLKGVIEGGRKDVLAVRRELHEGNGRVVVVDECLQALTTGRVPDSAEAVVTGWHNERSIAIEVNGRDGIGVCREGLQALSCSDVPNSHRLVEAARHNEITLRVEVAAEDVVTVTFESF